MIGYREIENTMIESENFGTVTILLPLRFHSKHDFALFLLRLRHIREIEYSIAQRRGASEIEYGIN